MPNLLGPLNQAPLSPAASPRTVNAPSSPLSDPQPAPQHSAPSPTIGPTVHHPSAPPMFPQSASQSSPSRSDSIAVKSNAHNTFHAPQNSTRNNGLRIEVQMPLKTQLPVVQGAMQSFDKNTTQYKAVKRTKLQHDQVHHRHIQHLTMSK